MSRTTELAARTVTWDTLQKSHKLQRGQIIEMVMREIDLRDRERQATEDMRSIKRNLNRFLTLIAAMLIGITVTYTLSHAVFGMWATKTFGPYAFVITILLDSGLAAYAWIKRY